MVWKSLLFIMIASANLIAQGYGKTKWGMSKEDVESFYKEYTFFAGEKMNEGEDIFFIKQNLFSVNSIVYFVFIKNKLARVTVAPDCKLSNFDCMYKSKMQLSTNLENKYGPPNTIKKTILGYTDRKWLLNETIILETSIITRDSKSDIIIYDIHYSPRPTSTDDGL